MRAAALLALLLPALGLRHDRAAGFRQVSSRQWGDWPKDGSQWKVLASSGPVRLRLQAFGALDAAAAAKTEQLQVSRIRMLFAGDIGYPGMITRTLQVPKSLSPRTVKRAGKPDALVLPASAALTYGVGSEDLVVYRAALSFLYCPKSRRLFQLEWFAPKKDFDKSSALAELDGFSCD